VSDSEQRDSDVAWLLAREQGQPGPSIPEQSAARYERLESLIVELETIPTPSRPGWRERTLKVLEESAGDANGTGSEGGDLVGEVATTSAPTTGRRTARRRWPVFAAAAMVAAAAGIIFLRVPRPQFSPEMMVSVEPGDSRSSEPRGSSAVAVHSIGDILVARAIVGDTGGEVRVYDRAGVVRASCKVSGPGCRIDRSDRRTTLVLTMRVETVGTLQAFLFAPALGTPPADRDADLRAAMQAQHTVLPGELEVFR
jgi:hypothetical protein